MGGYNMTKHLPKEKITFIPYNGLKGFYDVNIFDLFIKDTTSSVKKDIVNKNSNKKPIKARINSSSISTYLSSSQFNYIKAQFIQYCMAGKTRCGGFSNFSENYCVKYSPKAYKTQKDFFNSFPKLYFKFLKDLTYVWFPQDYMNFTKGD